MLAPGTNPTNNLLQGVPGESDLELSIGQFLYPLGIVPGSLAHQLSGERVKLQGYFIRFISSLCQTWKPSLKRCRRSRGGFFKRAPG